MSTPISELITTNQDKIRKYLATTDAQWNSILAKIQRREEWQQNIAGEKIWTFLIAAGYAIAEIEGITALSRLLAGSDLLSPINPRIWFEAQSTGPRDLKSEGKTRIDLALGMIRQMSNTASGIELATSKPGSICFCEVKWDTDISPGVTYDTTRNQLARDIENAVCFQTAGRYPTKVFFTIITPRNYETLLPNSLLSQKYKLYQHNRSALMDELTHCILPHNQNWNWVYPKNLSERLNEKNLVMRWIFMEELVIALPTSSLSHALRETWSNEVAPVG